MKTYLPTLKTHVLNLKRDAKDLADLDQRLEVRGKLGSKTLYSYRSNIVFLYEETYHNKRDSVK